MTKPKEVNEPVTFLLDIEEIHNDGQFLYVKVSGNYGYYCMSRHFFITLIKQAERAIAPKGVKQWLEDREIN